MTLTREKGTFTKTTSTSTPVSQQVNLVDSSLTPKIIILWTSGQTTSDGTYTDHTLWSYGWSDTANDCCQATRCHETNENEAYVIRNDSIISILSLTAGSEVSRADVSAVAAGSFTLNWSTQSDTSAMVIHYEVIGGTDITNVSAFTGTHLNFTTGNHSYNGSGTTFTPEFALIMSSSDSAIVVNTISSAATKNVWGMGAVTGTSNQWATCHRVATATTSNTAMLFDPAACFAILNPSSEAAAWVGSFVSFNNSAGGGITMNVTNAAGNTGVHAFLLVKGGKWDVKAFQQPAATGTQNVSLTDSTVTPKLVSLVGIGSATATTGQVHDYFCIGGSDGTREGNCYGGNTDALSNYQTARSCDTGKIYRMATAPAATASSTSTTAECDMNSMSTAGQFTLDWTTADSTQRQMGYWMVGEVVSGTTFNRSPTAEDITVADSSVTRLLSAARAPSTDTTTVADSSLTRMLSSVRVPSADTIIVADSSITKSETRVRATPADSLTVVDSSLTRLLSAVRVPTTEVPALGENLTRMLSATRIPSSDTVTAVDSSTTKSATRVRAPTTDTVTPSDSSLTRMLSAVRAPNPEAVSPSETSLVRTLQAFRSPSADTITINENLSGGKVIGRIPATETVTVVDSSLTRILSSTRVPATDSITVLDSSLTRMLSLLRIPSQDSITTSENLTSQYSQGAQTINRAPTAETITVADASLTRLLSALRLPSPDTTSIGEPLLTRILSAIRSPSSDTVVTADNATRIRSLSRATAADSITVLDSSVTRMLSALRLPSQDTITVTAGTATRMKSALRLPSVEVISISESLGSTVSGRISRSVSDTVNVVESSLNRMLQAFRVVPTDTTNVNEQLTRSRTAVRLTTADTSVVSEAALTRVVSLTRSVTSDTTAIIESALNRILSAARNLQDTVTVAELQSLIQHSRVLQDTISVTEPSLNRIVTAIRAVAPEFIDVTESVFFQTFHKFVFDSVTVAESLFKERTQLSGSVTYATPDEVRPLLGNIGPTQRTDDQINLAIDAAYDEINTKTNRIPPDDWKDTDHNFGVIKKLARYIAAKEMAVGIKDFDTAALDTEIEHLWEILTYDTTSSATQNIVVTSQPETYASLREGIIWSTRYKNLKKNSGTGDEGSLNIPVD